MSIKEIRQLSEKSLLEKIKEQRLVLLQSYANKKGKSMEQSHLLRERKRSLARMLTILGELRDKA